MSLFCPLKCLEWPLGLPDAVRCTPISWVDTRKMFVKTGLESGGSQNSVRELLYSAENRWRIFGRTRSLNSEVMAHGSPKLHRIVVPQETWKRSPPLVV